MVHDSHNLVCGFLEEFFSVIDGPLTVIFIHCEQFGRKWSKYFLAFNVHIIVPN